MALVFGGAASQINIKLDLGLRIKVQILDPEFCQSTLMALRKTFVWLTQQASCNLLLSDF